MKIIQFVMILAISGLLFSCTKELERNNDPEFTTQNKEGIKYFESPDDFISASKMLTKLNKSNYLKWEQENFRTHTIYGNYLRALKESESV